MTPTENNNRLIAAKKVLDLKVEQWHLEPALPHVLKASAWLTGLLTTSAVIGFA